MRPGRRNLSRVGSTPRAVPTEHSEKTGVQPGNCSPGECLFCVPAKVRKFDEWSSDEASARQIFHAMNPATRIAPDPTHERTGGARLVTGAHGIAS